MSSHSSMEFNNCLMKHDPPWSGNDQGQSGSTPALSVPRPTELPTDFQSEDSTESAKTTGVVPSIHAYSSPVSVHHTSVIHHCKRPTVLSKSPQSPLLVVPVVAKRTRITFKCPSVDLIVSPSTATNSSKLSVSCDDLSASNTDSTSNSWDQVSPSLLDEYEKKGHTVYQDEAPISYEEMESLDREHVRSPEGLHDESTDALHSPHSPIDIISMPRKSINGHVDSDLKEGHGHTEQEDHQELSDPSNRNGTQWVKADSHDMDEPRRKESIDNGNESQHMNRQHEMGHTHQGVTGTYYDESTVRHPFQRDDEGEIHHSNFQYEQHAGLADPQSDHAGAQHPHSLQPEARIPEGGFEYSPREDFDHPQREEFDHPQGEQFDHPPQNEAFEQHSPRDDFGHPPEKDFEHHLKDDFEDPYHVTPSDASAATPPISMDTYQRQETAESDQQLTDATTEHEIGSSEGVIHEQYTGDLLGGMSGKDEMESGPGESAHVVEEPGSVSTEDTVDHVADSMAPFKVQDNESMNYGDKLDEENQEKDVLGEHEQPGDEERKIETGNDDGGIGDGGHVPVHAPGTEEAVGIYSQPETQEALGIHSAPETPEAMGTYSPPETQGSVDMFGQMSPESESLSMEMASHDLGQDAEERPHDFGHGTDTGDVHGSFEPAGDFGTHFQHAVEEKEDLHGDLEDGLRSQREQDYDREEANQREEVNEGENMRREKEQPFEEQQSVHLHLQEVPSQDHHEEGATTDQSPVVEEPQEEQGTEYGRDEYLNDHDKPLDERLDTVEFHTEPVRAEIEAAEEQVQLEHQEQFPQSPEIHEPDQFPQSPEIREQDGIHQPGADHFNQSMITPDQEGHGEMEYSTEEQLDDASTRTYESQEEGRVYYDTPREEEDERGFAQIQMANQQESTEDVDPMEHHKGEDAFTGHEMNQPAGVTAFSDQTSILPERPDTEDQVLEPDQVHEFPVQTDQEHDRVPSDDGILGYPESPQDQQGLQVEVTHPEMYEDQGNTLSPVSRRPETPGSRHHTPPPGLDEIIKESVEHHEEERNLEEEVIGRSLEEEIGDVARNLEDERREERREEVMMPEVPSVQVYDEPESMEREQFKHEDVERGEQPEMEEIEHEKFDGEKEVEPGDTAPVGRHLEFEHSYDHQNEGIEAHSPEVTYKEEEPEGITVQQDEQELTILGDQVHEHEQGSPEESEKVDLIEEQNFRHEPIGWNDDAQNVGVGGVAIPEAQPAHDEMSSVPPQVPEHLEQHFPSGEDQIRLEEGKEEMRHVPEFEGRHEPIFDGKIDEEVPFQEPEVGEQQQEHLEQAQFESRQLDQRQLDAGYLDQLEEIGKLEQSEKLEQPEHWDHSEHLEQSKQLEAKHLEPEHVEQQQMMPDQTEASHLEPEQFEHEMFPVQHVQEAEAPHPTAPADHFDHGHIRTSVDKHPAFDHIQQEAVDHIREDSGLPKSPELAPDHISIETMEQRTESASPEQISPPFPIREESLGSKSSSIRSASPQKRATSPMKALKKSPAAPAPSPRPKPPQTAPAAAPPRGRPTRSTGTKPATLTTAEKFARRAQSHSPASAVVGHRIPMAPTVGQIDENEERGLKVQKQKVEILAPFGERGTSLRAKRAQSTSKKGDEDKSAEKEQRRQEAEAAYQAWLQRKAIERKRGRSTGRGLIADPSAHVSPAQKPPPTEEISSEEKQKRRAEAEAAFQAWLERKKEEEKERKRALMAASKSMQDVWIKRQDADEAFRRWKKQKNQQKRCLANENWHEFETMIALGSFVDTCFKSSISTSGFNRLTCFRRRAVSSQNRRSLATPKNARENDADGCLPDLGTIDSSGCIGRSASLQPNIRTVSPWHQKRNRRIIAKYSDENASSFSPVTPHRSHD